MGGYGSDDDAMSYGGDLDDERGDFLALNEPEPDEEEDEEEEGSLTKCCWQCTLS